MAKILPSWIFHPWSYLIVETSLMVFTVGFTKPSSFIRPALFPVVLYLVYKFISEAHLISNSFHASFGASDAWLTFLQYVDVALLSKWDFDYSGPQPVEPSRKNKEPYSKSSGILSRLGFGIYAASSYRCSGTSFEVPNLAHFDRKNPNYVPSRAKYVRGALIRVTIVYLLIDTLTSFNDPAAMAHLFSDSKIPLLSRLSEVTFEEATSRFITSFMFWLVNYLTLMLFFDIPGIICVATGVSGVEWWRPPFNSILEAWTLRRYWGVFWHQSVRKRINHPASFITKSILNLPRGLLVTRYTALILTFTMSTIQHASGDIASGIPPSRTGSPAFFLIQALGFIMEDLCQAVWKYIAQASFNNRTWPRVAGYIWVLAWMYWTTPFYAYPVSANNKGEKDAILPFSVLRMFVSR